MKLPSVEATIAAHGLAAKKSLGQHFLTDAGLLKEIARSAGNLAGMDVIEIGPGPGGLTRALLDTEARQVIAIEKDARCLAALAPLKQHYGTRFTLIEQDAMRADITALGDAPRAVVANLPYNIGTALILNWLEAAQRHGRSALQHFTVMLQKEVGERLVAMPGDKHYGRLSVLMHLLTDAHEVLHVPPHAFTPPPKVDSVVVHARILEAPRIAVDIAMLEQVTATAFNQRRKMLRQALKPLGGEALCERAGIDPTLRAEQCSLEMFGKLALNL